VLAVTFYLLATHCPFKSPKLSMPVDFLVFFAAAGVCTWLATYIAITFGLSIESATHVPGFKDAVALRVFPFTAATLVGVLGAIQCRISRRKEPGTATAPSQ